MTRPDSQRVAVTGMGLVTPVGNDVPSSWSAILAGRSGIGFITEFDHSAFKTHIAAEVKNFDASLYVDKKDTRRMDRFLHFAAAAAQEAVADAKLDVTYFTPRRVGVVVGSGIGGVHILLEQHDIMNARGPRRVSPFTVSGLILNSAAAHISIMLGARGPNYAIATACATGTHTIGEAAEIIRRGSADAMICGGSEAAIVPMAMAGFENMGALSGHNDEPERSSRPFDLHRDGFVMGEGAGVVVLEEYEHAKARGAKIYAEVLGYGLSGDAYHITAPAEDGEGGYRSMAMALKRAGLQPSEIDYINAHGTSTMADTIELGAVERLLGNAAAQATMS